MSKHPIGGVEWFYDKKRELVDHVRAADNFAMALTAVEALQSTWKSGDGTAALALHTTAVINYARPFSSNRGKDGAKRIYSKGHIDKTPGFDGAMHRHLLELRDKLIAHSDADYADAGTFSFEVMVSGFDTVANQDFATEVPVEVRVSARALHSIKQEMLVTKYVAHMAAAAAGAADKLRSEMQVYLRAAQEHIDAHRRARQSDLPEFFRQEEKLPSEGKLQVRYAPPPTSQTLKIPPLGALSDDYLYRLIEFGVRQHGEYRFVTPSGAEIKVVFGPTATKSEVE